MSALAVAGRGLLTIAHGLQLVEERLQAFSVDVTSDGFVGFLDDPCPNLRVIPGLWTKRGGQHKHASRRA
jgi:hypothetical protein